MTGKNRLILTVGGAIALLLVILFQTGVFVSGKIAPGNHRAKPQPVSGEVIEVEESIVPKFYSAVGTIHSRTEVELSARITARVLEVKKRSGDKVQKGETLIELDKNDLKALLVQAERRVDQATSGIAAAEQGVKKAEATLKLSEENFKRDQILFSKNVIPQKVFDQTLSRHDQAISFLAQMKQLKIQADAIKKATQETVKEVAAKLGYATIKSPFDGVVAQQLADPGDLASPGIILMTVFDPKRIMLYVPVREGLVSQIKINETFDIDVPALKLTVPGKVREIVPSVETGSRTFLVKITVLDGNGLMPGMFATLKLAVGSKKVIIIPDSAIEHIGQLEYATIITSNKSKTKRLIRTVPYQNKRRIVISGLNMNDVIIKSKL